MGNEPGEMIFSYGPGGYQKGHRQHQGEIILAPYRLYLRDAGGDIAPTYTLLERVLRVRQTLQGLKIRVRLSSLEDYEVTLTAPRRVLGDLARDLAARRGLRRKLFWPEWYDPDVSG